MEPQVRRLILALVLACCLLAPATAPAQVVGQGNACPRNGEQSWVAGVFLLCTGNVWTGQAPQAVSAGLNTTACDTSKVGLLRVYKTTVAPISNMLQFCDGTLWKTISLL